MNTILVMGSPVLDDCTPGSEFKLRLNKVKSIFTPGDKIIVTGRIGNTLKPYPITQAESGRNYLVSSGIDPESILMETLSAETCGNFAFSAPIISSLQPKFLTIVSSIYVKDRVEYLAKKVFGSKQNIKYEYIQSTQSGSKESILREVKALNMFKMLLENITDGDNMSIIITLLSKTPFYIKNYITDKDFFDKYWIPGGWADFTVNKELVHKLTKE